MKLILSSCDFRNKFSAKSIYDNLNMPINECRVLYFPNEKSTEELILSGMYHSRLEEFGFISKNIFVFNYWCPEKFFDLDIDAVYISGGNTFGTLKRIREANADTAIINYVKDSAVYIGGSAGAHIACSDISHVSEFDTNTFGIDNFRGLGLYDGKLICHYNKERRNVFEQLKKESSCNVTALTNDEYIIIVKQ